VKVTFLGHAELLIEAAGKRILIDPWLVEPVFAGAWFRYPPRPYARLADLGPLDAVILSHEHPDHAGVGTLKALPDVPIFAMDFVSPTLRRNTERAGRKVEWLAAGVTRALAPDLSFTLLPHSAGWQVASVVVESEGVRIYHGNDNAMPLDGYQAIQRRFPRVDIAFLPFAGASSYPTCFEWSAEVIAQKGEAKKTEGIERLEDGIRGLRPLRAVPFASSWALLEPGSIEKNYVDRATPEEAIARTTKFAQEHDTELLLFEVGDEWTPADGLVSKGLSKAWKHDLGSVRSYADKERERVTRSIAEARQIPSGARDVKAPFLQHLEALIDASRGMLAELDGVTIAVAAEGGPAFSLRFAHGQRPVIVEGAEGADEVLIIDLPELWAVLVGTWLWEDIWYGYRMRVQKREGTPYYRAFWDALLFFDDFELKQILRRDAQSASQTGSSIASEVQDAGAPTGEQRDGVPPGISTK